MNRASRLRNLAWSFLLSGTVLLWVLGAPAPVSAQQVLDRIEIVETPTAAEIHIAFNTRIIYQRHTPSDQGDLIRVFLDLPDLDRSRRFARELAASPPSDLLPKFTVTFPDQGTTGLAIKFARPVRFRISQRGNERNKIVIAVKLDRPLMPLPPPPEARFPPPVSPEAKKPAPSFDIPAFRPGMNVEQYATTLLQLGQGALTAGEYEKAVQIFNALLNLPPNKQSREAQEMVGVARERNGETSKAIAEYEHYLKTYPDGEGAARVQQRLTALKTATAQTAQQKAAGRAPRRIEETSVYGSVYQYYYGGYSQSKTTDKLSNTTTTFNNHDQSLLQTAFDVTGRYRKNEYDNKLVVRGTESYDLLAVDDARKSVSRLRALYFEHSSQDSYLLRIGRQPGNTGGVLDFRFDGAWIRYTPLPQFLSLNLLGGQPRQFSLTPNYVPDDPRNFNLDSNRYFYGANVDIGPIGQAWSGNAYYFNQMVNGVTDRRAVGTEVRYASNGRNLYGLVDYDIYFNALNIATLNGTWVTDKTTFNFMADHRRTPYLQTTNALFGITGASLDNITKENESLLRAEAKNVTATSDLFLAGVLHSVSKDWQLGGDVRLNRISGASASQCLIIAPGTSTVFLNPNAVTDASCSLQGIPGTGNIWTYTVQGIGTDFPFDKNTFVVNASYISSSAYRGESLTLNSLGRYWQQWQMDVFLILYHQKDNNNVNLYRGTPTLRIDYRFFDSWTFEASGGVEKTLTDSPTQKDSTLREFFFFGLRWDFS